ncbi:hypothetical protein DZK25_00835 [Wenzhouxiangella sp. 15181]|nr:hypothetical protein DZK25_00835 [Wenzhouxiangella sp. 15181]
MSFIAALAMAASVAVAQNPSFEEMDRNDDGLISGSEAMALPCLAQVYNRIEKEDDAGLNRSEYNAATQKHCQSSQSQEDDWPES